MTEQDLATIRHAERIASVEGFKARCRDESQRDPYLDRREQPERVRFMDRGDGFAHGDKATWR